ncbi:MAG: radical SAM protein [bacterium]|nr:radical SAM protein [bacterium]
MGIATLLAVLKSRGFPATAVDLNAESYAFASATQRPLWNSQRILDFIDAERFSEILPTIQPILRYCTDRLLSTPCRVIGFSLFRTNLRFSVEVAARIKRSDPDRLIIFGGPSCDVAGERRWIPSGTVDALVVGDAEESLPQLLTSLSSSSPAPRGVIWGEDLKPDRVLNREVMPDLNSCPFPDFSDFNLTHYQRRHHSGDQYLPVVGSRGCIMHCAYCNDHVFSRPYRPRTAEDIFAELRHQYHLYGTGAFHFNDLLINGRLDVLDRLATLLCEANLPISWIGQAIPRGDMSESLLNKLARSGLEMITYGVESGSSRIRALMNKNPRLIAPEKALRSTHRAGIRTAVNLMVGFPGETDQDFSETLAFVQRNSNHIDLIESIHPVFISPNSPLEVDPSTFDVEPLGDSPIERAIRWKGVDGSTYELRKARLLELAQLLQDLGIEYPHNRLNLLDG